MNLICREDLITGLIGLIIVLQFIFCSSVGKGLFMIQNEDITVLYFVQALSFNDYRDTSYLSVFSPNAEKYGPENTPYLDTFHAVMLLPIYHVFPYFFGF